jgi:KipI family sensor histidine kinase inhibitor
MAASTSDGLAPTVQPFGDAALIVRLEDRMDPAIARRAGAIARAIQAARHGVPAIGRPVPAHSTVLVPFDPLAIEPDRAAAVILELASGASPAAAEGVDEAPFEVPVRYGGADGPDLAEVAQRLRLTPDEVASLHASTAYAVAFLGFAPGFAYLGSLPPELQVPRRTTPRERVPAGSVAIAGELTAIYPGSMPGGWHLIGRTDAVLFDPMVEPPTPLRPGRFVRFVPVP